MIKLVGGLVLLVSLLGTGSIWLYKKNKELKNNLAYTNSLYKDAALQLGQATIQLGDANKKLSSLSEELRGQIKARQEIGIRYTELRAKYVAIGSVSNQSLDSEFIPIVVNNKLNLSEGHFYFAADPSNTRIIDLGPKVKLQLSDPRITILGQLNSEVNSSTKTLLPYAAISYKFTFKLKAKLITTITPAGKENTYAELYETNAKGEEIGKFELEGFEVVTNDQRSKSFTCWNPHLDAGVVAGYNGDVELGGSIGISLMSYGVTKNDMSWRFLRPGITLSKKVGLNIVPVLFNIAEPLPLVSNLWLGPYIGYDFTNVGAGLMLNLVL